MADQQKQLIFESDDENQEEQIDQPQTAVADTGGHGVHSTSFADFFLKPELLRATGDSGFEQPSLVQKEAIPVALLGEDLICQAKSGMGKTAVFVLTVLHNLDLTDTKKGVQAIVLTHARELAYQIHNEFLRLGKYFVALKSEMLIGGVPVKKHKLKLSLTPPQVVVGTPGRILDLVKQKALVLDNLKFFILDECDQMLEQVGKISPL